jgi:hypothetical protein
MALDGKILGNCASEQMEALEADFGDDESVRIGTVITIVEVQNAEGTDEDGNEKFGSTIRFRHNTPDPYRMIGILDQAKHAMLAS